MGSDDDGKVEFTKELHLGFLKSLDARIGRLDYWQAEYLRMSGLYWALAALFLLEPGLQAHSEAFERASPLSREAILNFITECQRPNGGFGGNIGNHDAHLTFTLSAIQIAIMLDALDDVRFNWNVHVKWIVERQNSDGSFSGDEFGEIDTRFSYCAIAALALLGKNNLTSLIDCSSAKEYILDCQNHDGGFSAVPGGESHSGQVFCCVGALVLLLGADEVKSLPQTEKLVEWLAWRQLSNGGLNGRPEKLEDVCYSWWIVSSLAMLNQTKAISLSALQSFILNCQDLVGDGIGGFADRPGDMADVFHTLFGLAGLSLTGNFAKIMESVDPRFCLPSRFIV